MSECLLDWFIRLGGFGALGNMDVSAATSVHNKEITRQICQDDFVSEQDFEQGFSLYLLAVDGTNCLERSYRESRLEEYADLVLVTESGLSEHDSIYGSNFLARFWECRTKAWRVQDPETLLVATQSNSCRLRWCPVCGGARVNIIVRNCFEFLHKQKAVRFLTLTMKHSSLPLGEQVRRVKKCFVRLSRRVGWKKYVTGAVCFLHVKENYEKTEYHVHLHIFLTGSYVPQEWLSAEWLKVTGDSPVVHVQAAHSEKELGLAIKDFARYAGRPANLSDISEEHRLEVVHAFEGIRVCWTTGICKAVSLSPPKYKEGDSKLVNLGRDSTIRRMAACGNLDALRILYCAKEKIPYPGIAPSFRDVDEFIDDSVVGLSRDRSKECERSPPVDCFLDFYDKDVW